MVMHMSTDALGISRETMGLQIATWHLGMMYAHKSTTLLTVQCAAVSVGASKACLQGCVNLHVLLLVLCVLSSTRYFVPAVMQWCMDQLTDGSRQGEVGPISNYTIEA